MKKVCFFDLHVSGQFHDYHIDSVDPGPYFRDNSRGNWRDFLAGGLNRFDKKRSLFFAEGVDRLYRQKDPAYMKFLAEFVHRYQDYDLIVMAICNLIHPEVLYHELRKPIKVLGFIDDPVSTYIRGIPYLWAFDGAFYASPSYSAKRYLVDALESWGCMQHYWFPLSFYPFKLPEKITEEFFSTRSRELVYVGKHYSAKIDRLIMLKKHFDSRFQIYGRWPLKGYSGIARGIAGRPMLRRRVRSLTDEARMKIYFNSKIGINMHFSDTPTETGNMRMYEVPAHGMMLLCDKAGLDAHEKIFEPYKEAVFYDSIDDAIDKAEYYLSHDDERIEIAKNGFNRVWRDYAWEKNILAFLHWASNLRPALDPRNSPRATTHAAT